MTATVTEVCELISCTV